jgi:DNA modification methylase
MLKKTLKKMEVTRGFIRIPTQKKAELLGNEATPFRTKLNDSPARVDNYGRIWSDYLKNRFAVNTEVTIDKSDAGFQLSEKRQEQEKAYPILEKRPPIDELSHCSFRQIDQIQNVVLSGNGETRNVIFRDMINLPSTTYATFGLYRYPAKFIPHVIAYILQQYAKPGMKVFDPFAGSGTVGVMSKIYGNDYELWDLNPIIETLHEIATMRPIGVNLVEVTQQMLSYDNEFIPSWSRHQYWFPSDFLPFLYKVWGYYHSLLDRDLKLTLTVPLLKTTRYFSYDDPQRQKLSKSSKSKERVNRLLSSDWERQFIRLFQNEVNKVLKGQREYNQLSPKSVNDIVRGGVDSLHEKLKEKKDILITSPPYVQSQEYIRQAKIDLFWLGHNEEEVKALSKLEIPYRNIEPKPIYSETFTEYEKTIKEKHILKVFDNYFWGVIGALSRLQENVSSYMFLFVGHSSTRGRATPIDKILVEHFTHLGWHHRATLMDKIVSRRLFSYKVNPATGLKDSRTLTENLVILEKR